MNIIYRLVNRKKENLQIYPCYYIGSKLRYVNGQYWGSSRHPILIQELNECITDFEIEILEQVDDPNQLLIRERYHQLAVDADKNPKYYNLSIANEKFSSVGKKWYYDPITLSKGYFLENKVPEGWLPGYKKEISEDSKRAAYYKENPTGLKKNDIRLRERISDSLTEYEWIVVDPYGNTYTVTKLHKFCEDHDLSPKLRYTKNIGKPLKKGKSKGWCVVSKKVIGH